MKKRLFCLLSVLVCTAIVPTKSSAWSEATHAYIADNIGYNYGLRNYSEIYGAMAPDIFNYDFSLATNPSLRVCIRDHTHGLPDTAYDFLEIWELSEGGRDRNAAYGYVSHNDAFGADFSAHWLGNTNSEEMGWVIQKSWELMDILEMFNAWDILDLDVNDSDDFKVAELICHVMVEYAGDIVIRREDPTIGIKIALASVLRTPQFPDILADAMECAQESYVRQMESEFREKTFQYGLTLLRDEDAVFNNLVSQLTGIAPAYLATTGMVLTLEQLEFILVLAYDGLDFALELVEDDYMDEIDAVIDELEDNMAVYGVAY